MGTPQAFVPQASRGCAGPPGPRKPVARMTEAEKTRALLVDELTGLGNRRAWEDRERRPVQAMLDVEGLKWVNDNVGWQAGDALLRVVAAAICDDGMRGYRLGGDEFVFEGEDEAEVASAIDRIRARLRGASIVAVGSDGTRRQLRGPRIHAGIGRSFDEAAATLRAAKKAGIAGGERAARGARPHGLADEASLGARVTGALQVVRRFLGRADGPTFRFYLRALREADPGFGDKRQGSASGMSLEWLVRNARRTAS